MLEFLRITLFVWYIDEWFTIVFKLFLHIYILFDYISNKIISSFIYLHNMRSDHVSLSKTSDYNNIVDYKLACSFTIKVTTVQINTLCLHYKQQYYDALDPYNRLIPHLMSNRYLLG